MNWLDLSQILGAKKAGERDLRLYPKCNFLNLYYKMDEDKVGPYESVELRKRWKDLLINWNTVNNLTWELARLRRRQGEEWNEYAKKRAHVIVFKLLNEIKYLYSEYMNLVNQTLPLWWNTVINLIRMANLSKEDVYEIMPQPQIANLKLLLRQIFDPILRVLSDLESKLLAGEVDEDKMRELEEMLLLNTLPYFERIYTRIVEKQR